MPELNYNEIPGMVKIIVRPYQAGDPAFAFRDAAGNVMPPGYRLGDLLQQHGDHMTVMDPFRGGHHVISLTQFSGHDPDTTHLQIKYEFHPDPAYIRTHPELFPPGPGLE